MKCFPDMDGVVSDFMTACHKYHKIEYDYEENYPYPIGEWDFVKYTGFTDKKFWEPLGRLFWSNLPLTKDWRMIYESVKDVFGDNICFLTSPTLNTGCASGKMEWIRNFFPEMRRKVFIGPWKEYLAHDGVVLIDDRDEYINRFKKNGGHGILVPRKWNSYGRDNIRFFLEELEDYV